MVLKQCINLLLKYQYQIVNMPSYMKTVAYQEDGGNYMFTEIVRKIVQKASSYLGHCDDSGTRKPGHCY